MRMLLPFFYLSLAPGLGVAVALWPGGTQAVHDGVGNGERALVPLRARPRLGRQQALKTNNFLRSPH